MPTTAVALVILLLFGVPGFITHTVVSSSIPRQQPNAQRWAVEVMVFGAINVLPTALVYGALIGCCKVPPPDLNSFPPKNPPLLVGIAIYALCFIILPSAIGLLLVLLYNQGHWKTLYRWLGIRYIDPAPRAWDGYFSQQKPCGVVATLVDGTKITGFMGKKSFAASYPAPEDLYLEIAYTYQEGVHMPQPVPNTGGVWIAGSQIRFLEFFVPPVIQESEDGRDRQPAEPSTAEPSTAEPSTASQPAGTESRAG